MNISFESVRLDTADGDGDGVLVFRDGQLFAVASRLSGAHGGMTGRWFIEAMFGPRDRWIGATFATQQDLKEWAASVDEAEIRIELRA